MIHHEGTKTTKATKVKGLALSHRLIGAAIEVHRLLGPGLLEVVYEEALCKELSLRGIEYQRQLGLPVYYKREMLGCSIKIDLIIDHSVIVELKSVEKLLPIHRSQLLTYLRLQNLWLGLLINFNVEVLRYGIRRILNG